MERVKGSVVARDWVGREDTERTFRAVKLLYVTIMMDTCHYTFVQTHRMYHTKREP